MAHPYQQMSSNTSTSPPTGKIQQTPRSSPPASRSSNSIDETLSQSTLYTSTEDPSKGLKEYQSVHQSQTSLSPLVAQAQASTPASTSSSSSSSSKTKFLKAIFDRKRKDSKKASQGSPNTTGSSSQASSSGAQTPPPARGSSSQKKNDSTQQPQPEVTAADLLYRYGGPALKIPRL